MTKTPWSKFFWADWESDERLYQCSLEAQALWMRMLCVCAKGDPYGYLAVAGHPLGAADVARRAGITTAKAEELMAELDQWGVFSRDRKGRIYSRRMVKDQKAARTAHKQGNQGGNPALKGGYNKPGFVYLMGPRSDGRYKVGISVNPKNRLKKVRTQNPGEDIELVEAWHVDDMGAAERAVHDYLSGSQSVSGSGSQGGFPSGEWFLLNHVTAEEIGKIAKTLKEPEKGSTRPRGQRPDPPSRPPTTSSLTEQALADEFERWWQQVPRKVGRKAAWKAFKSARQEASFDTLMSAIQAFAKQVQDKEKRYVPHPATWLNQGRWMDEDLADQAGAGESTQAAEEVRQWLREHGAA